MSSPKQTPIIAGSQPRRAIFASFCPSTAGSIARRCRRVDPQNRSRRSRYLPAYRKYRPTYRRFSQSLSTLRNKFLICGGTVAPLAPGDFYLAGALIDFLFTPPPRYPRPFDTRPFINNATRLDTKRRILRGSFRS